MSDNHVALSLVVTIRRPSIKRFYALLFSIFLVYVLHFSFYYWLTDRIVGTSFSLGWLLVYIAFLRTFHPSTYWLVQWCIKTTYPAITTVTDESGLASK